MLRCAEDESTLIAESFEFARWKDFHDGLALLRLAARLHELIGSICACERALLPLRGNSVPQCLITFMETGSPVHASLLGSYR